MRSATTIRQHSDVYIGGFGFWFLILQPIVLYYGKIFAVFIFLHILLLIVGFDCYTQVVDIRVNKTHNIEAVLQCQLSVRVHRHCGAEKKRSK